MKILTLMLAAAALLLAQEKDTKKSKDAKKSEASQAVPSDAPKSEQIPKDAVRVERNAYRYVDPQGKVWYYHQLPFGVSKYEAKPAETTPVNEEPAILVHDLGDSIEFQRNTPFGVSKWNRKKTDLTAEEKVAIAADEAKRSAGSKEAGAAPKEAAKEKNDKTTEKREKQ